nr:ribonuclease H-like domain-containing protein [Tanacetum cinerariifolium]
MGKKGKAVKPSACWTWNPSQKLSNKGLINNSVSVMFKKYTYIDTQGYWDSGCSRHMTGNISYLSDFESFDGGYVSFGQGGCKITCKGTIKTKCIVLGRNFKLLDDANILLRTPRQYNMYSIDLNNIVPHKDLTCLVAKASADECILWHRRLGHLNVKTMNKLVRHNLVRGLPTKSFNNDHTCTACLKGKQHKASKGEFNSDFHPMVDFIAASPLRRNLKLRDEDGIVSIPDTELFENLTLMGLATSDKEMKLWVELKRMYEPDPEDQLWTLTQRFMHAHIEWKLYDLSGLHHVTAKDKEIFILVEKDYPIIRGLALVMISYKLQVKDYSQMAKDLIRKIYNIANTPRQQGD